MYRCQKCGKIQSSNLHPCSKCKSTDFIKIDPETTPPQIDNKEKVEEHDDYER